MTWAMWCDPSHAMWIRLCCVRQTLQCDRSHFVLQLRCFNKNNDFLHLRIFVLLSIEPPPIDTVAKAKAEHSKGS